jgi:hypothetical protein
MKILLSIVMAVAVLTSTSANAWEKLTAEEKIGIGLGVLGAVKTVANMKKEQEAAEEEKKQQAEITKEILRERDEQSRLAWAAKKLLDKKITGNFNINLGDVFSKELCIDDLVNTANRAGKLNGASCRVSTRSSSFFDKAVVKINPINNKIFSVAGIREHQLPKKEDVKREQFANPETELVARLLIDDDIPWSKHCDEQMTIVRNILKKKYGLEFSADAKMNHTTDNLEQHAWGNEKAVGLFCSRLPYKAVKLTVDYFTIDGEKQTMDDLAEAAKQKRKEMINENVKEQIDSF